MSESRQLLGRAAVLMSFALMLLSGPAMALTLEELRQTPSLTPEKFASYFASFKFRFRADVQRPDVFLATGVGDCDDYATLAAGILREKGYTPRLVAVRMKQMVHVVCYIEETKSILDFNQRGRGRPLLESRNTLDEIAEAVATTFNSPWRSVSEFTFEDGAKRLVKTSIKSEENRTVRITQVR